MLRFQRCRVRVFRCARYLRSTKTEPVDYLQQDNWFLNCVVEGETGLPAGTFAAGKLRRHAKCGDGQRKKRSAKGANADSRHRYSLIWRRDNRDAGPASSASADDTAAICARPAR